MLGLDKVLSWVFRCCGISPSGTQIDKYFAITAIILTIIIPLRRYVLVHVEYGSTEETVLIAMRILIAFATVGLIISNWMEPETYINIVKDLESIGNQIKSTNDKRVLKLTCVILATLSLIQLLIYYQISFVLTTVVLANAILVHGPSLQHMIIVERIKNKFSALNDLVLGIATDSSIASTKLDNAFHLHSSLHALVVDVDVHFGLFNLFSFIAKFVFCVFEMYGYLSSIENGNDRLSFILFISFLRQVVVFVSQALVCHACAKEANLTVLLAHRVLQPDSSLDLWEQVGLFSALAVDNKVHFTIGGIFTLDRALITQTALTALSYLIIAIQLREIKLF